MLLLGGQVALWSGVVTEVALCGPSQHWLHHHYNDLEAYSFIDRSVNYHIMLSNEAFDISVPYNGVQQLACRY